MRTFKKGFNLGWGYGGFRQRKCCVRWDEERAFWVEGTAHAKTLRQKSTCVEATENRLEGMRYQKKARATLYRASQISRQGDWIFAVCSESHYSILSKGLKLTQCTLHFHNIPLTTGCRMDGGWEQGDQWDGYCSHPVLIFGWWRRVVRSEISAFWAEVHKGGKWWKQNSNPGIDVPKSIPSKGYMETNLYFFTVGIDFPL